MTPESSPAGSQANPSGTTVDTEYRVIDLGKYAQLFWNRRYFIAGCAILGLAAGYLDAFITPPQFDATVRLMPPTQKQSLLASLSPARNEGDLYLGLISSRTVADDVIERQHLADYFHTTKPSVLRSDLGLIAKISVDKDQFVTVTVRASKPEIALRIANEFPDALYRLSKSIAVSQAEHRWEYFEGPLEQEKNNLAYAEEQLKQAQQKTGMVLPEAQVQLALSAIASLKQQITSRQEQLAALETGSTDQNPQVVQLKSQIAILAGQLHSLEAKNGGSGSSSVAAATPQLTLELARLTREVKFHETLFEVLSRQYENARVDDSYSPSIELVDRAVLPDQKSWPSRRFYALIGFLAGGLIGLVATWFRR